MKPPKIELILGNVFQIHKFIQTNGKRKHLVMENAKDNMLNKIYANLF